MLIGFGLWAVLVLFGTVPWSQDPDKAIIQLSEIVVPGFYVISLSITVTATSLIIYRIASVVKQIEGNTTRYNLTLEVLIESGGLYAASLLLTLVLYIAGGDHDNPRPIGIVRSVWQYGILPPMIVRSIFII